MVYTIEYYTIVINFKYLLLVYYYNYYYENYVDAGMLEVLPQGASKAEGLQ